MIQFNFNGIKAEWHFPRWLKRFLMKRQGLCAKEHSEFPGLYCVHKPGHDGWCGCA